MHILKKGCHFIILLFVEKFHLSYLIYLFTVLYNMFLTAVRHDVNNLESSVVVQDLE